MTPSARTVILLLGQPQAVRCPPLERLGQTRHRACCIRPHIRPSASGPAVAEMRPLYFFSSRNRVSIASWRSAVVNSIFVGVQPAGAHVPGGVRAETGKTQVLQQEFCRPFQVVHIVLMDGHPHSNLHTMPLEGAESLELPPQMTPSRAPGHAIRAFEPSTEICT